MLEDSIGSFSTFQLLLEFGKIRGDRILVLLVRSIENRILWVLVLFLKSFRRETKLKREIAPFSQSVGRRSPDAHEGEDHRLI